jgi:hypothetical protein
MRDYGDKVVAVYGISANNVIRATATCGAG